MRSSTAEVLHTTPRPTIVVLAVMARSLFDEEYRFRVGAWLSNRHGVVRSSQSCDTAWFGRSLPDDASLHRVRTPGVVVERWYRRW
jgi:hypothetical protein